MGYVDEHDTYDNVATDLIQQFVIVAYSHLTTELCLMLISWLMTSRISNLINSRYLSHKLCMTRICHTLVILKS